MILKEFLKQFLTEYQSRDIPEGWKDKMVVLVFKKYIKVAALFIMRNLVTLKVLECINEE